MAVSVTAPAGFRAGGAWIGIKAGGALDAAFVGSADGEPVVAAAVFATTDSPAAPIEVSRAHLAGSGRRVRGVVLTSGNANAATGEAGRAAARRLLEAAAHAFGGRAEDYLIAQTGLIGISFPIDAALAGFGALTASVGVDERSAETAARAIMTTDTHPKTALVEGDGFRVGGLAKGAAMIAPQMATMLAVITTDAAVEAERLDAALRAAVETTFNRITIDGCSSTNDTVVALASGRGRSPGEEFEEAVREVCAQLAHQIVADAEGGSRVGVVRVLEARDEDEALLIARQIANSLLVKASLLGGDPYWGRVLAEVGAARRGVDPSGVRIWYQGMLVAEGGLEARGGWSANEHEELTRRMAQPEVDLAVALGRGSASATVLTSDIGHGYLEENRRTS
ncbi:arginine biosynthesis bifunctional protein ArgJ [Acidimicrobium ferrooxidans DSM 10331]|uniref:Arginine biosynthesis bifunctional protein ArgJ n=1 Tax=Acidimicrobium ferrooxidans (strain DSM 10331 / JCM 15462 / NBRC 103882 / ICP) TaxID=525909 RepID=C7M0S2_ACIFD|nr:arginine biosynthesis bifunctional protein ArgJ [Acidimicrobium ferrooxidans DSM 10331]